MKSAFLTRFFVFSVYCGLLWACKTTEKAAPPKANDFQPSGSIQSPPAPAPKSADEIFSLTTQLNTGISQIRDLCRQMAVSLSPDEKKFCDNVLSSSDAALAAFFQTGYLNQVLENRIRQSEKESAFLSQPGMKLASSESEEDEKHLEKPERSYAKMAHEHLIYAAYSAVFVLGFIELDATWSLIKATKLKGDFKTPRGVQSLFASGGLKAAYGAWGLFIGISIAEHLGHLAHGPTQQTWKDLGETFVIAGLFSFGVAALSYRSYHAHLAQVDTLDSFLSINVREGKKEFRYQEWLTDYKKALGHDHNAVENFIRQKYQIEGDLSHHSAAVINKDGGIETGKANKDVAEFLETAENYRHGIDGEIKAGILQMAAAAAFVSIGYVLSRNSGDKGRDSGQKSGQGLHLAQSGSFRDQLKPLLTNLMDLSKSSPAYPDLEPPGL